MMNLRYTLLPLAAALLLSACAINQSAPPAALPAPALFKEAGPWQRADTSAALSVPDAWWTLFKDPVLDDLQRRLVIGNETLKSSVAAVANARAVLVGLAPSALTIAPTATLPDTLQVPVTLPATLLQRRPDIAAAQARVAASYAQIGVTDAAFFPALTLSGGAGFSHSSLASLMNAPNLFWSLGSSLAQSIFDGGQRQQASAQARASADQATSAYRLTVLTALQEVEDNLILGAQLQQELIWQGDALKSSQRNLGITLDQYRAGTVSYLNVVSAQTAALTSESSLLAVRNRQLAAVNQLLKNIAGRWEPVGQALPEQASAVP